MGEDRDIPLARKSWRRFPESGSAYFQFMLGYMYDTGEGVPQDQDRAIRRYRKAAEHGLGAAQAKLGSMYQLGRGVNACRVAAYAWFDIATKNGFAPAKGLRDALAEKTTSERIFEAQELSRELRAKNPSLIREHQRDRSVPGMRL